MKYVLVIVEEKIDSGSTMTLQNLARSIASFGLQSAAIECLNSGAYLLRLEHGLRPLTHLHTEAEKYGLTLKVLFLESEPEWISSK